MARGNERTQQLGFTLVEMLVALGILVFGLTSLIGLMTVGVSTRQAAELRDRAGLAAQEVFHDLETAVFSAQKRSEDDGELPRLEEISGAVEGFPRLFKRIVFKSDESLPDLVLVEVHISWFEEGLTVSEVFRRVMDRRVPFPTRVARARSNKQ